MKTKICRNANTFNLVIGNDANEHRQKSHFCGIIIFGNRSINRAIIQIPNYCHMPDASSRG